MRRREFIALVGSAAVALPRVVCAQQPIPVIVFFNSGTPSTHVKNLAAFRKGLKEAGLVEGQNLAIEFVWAENRFDGLETLAAEVIARRPSVIISNTLAAIRAKSSTMAIPIVFTTGSDPVRDGLVTSLNRPGGNVTGVVFITGTVGGKRLELLRQLVPKAGTIAMLVNPGTSENDAERAEVQAAAQAVGQQNSHCREPQHGRDRDGSRGRRGSWRGRAANRHRYFLVQQPRAYQSNRPRATRFQRCTRCVNMSKLAV